VALNSLILATNITYAIIKCTPFLALIAEIGPAVLDVLRVLADHSRLTFARFGAPIALILGVLTSFTFAILVAI
jgi:hypothetical protein